MLNESLKRRWPEPAAVFYEPPQKVRLVCSQANFTPDFEISRRRILCGNFSEAACVNRRDPAGFDKGVRQTNHRKRKFSSSEEHTGSDTDSQTLNDCTPSNRTTHPEDTNLLTQPVKRLRRSPTEDSLCRSEAMNSEYNEFNFWKPLLPDIEAELNAMLLSVTSSSQDSTSGATVEVTSDSQESRHSLGSCYSDVEEERFNNFNFWRAPVPDLDIDLDL